MFKLFPPRSPSELLTYPLGSPVALLALTAAIFTFGPSTPARAAGTDTTTPVGGTIVQINGAGGATNQLTFLGLPFLPVVSVGGTVADSSANSIENTVSQWTADQFAGSNGRFFVEITSNDYTGSLAEITGNSTNTITTADSLPALTGGTTFRIRRMRTLSEVFGTPPTVLQGGTATTADEVMLCESGGTFVSYYYKTSGLGGTGWRKVGDASTDRSNLPLWITDGVMIRRKQSAHTFLTLLGEVKTGTSAILIEPGTNLIANLSSVNGLLTLGNSGLYNAAAPQKSLTGGSATTADTVQIYNPGTSAYSAYYYKTSGLGGTGWRLVGDAATNAANVPLPASSSVIIQRKSGAAFMWQAPAVYTATN